MRVKRTNDISRLAIYGNGVVQGAGHFGELQDQAEGQIEHVISRPLHSLENADSTDKNIEEMEWRNRGTGKRWRMEMQEVCKAMSANL